MSLYSAGQPLEVPPAEIINSPTNPRKKKGLDLDSLNAMAASIRANGVMQPIVVRPLPGERVADTAHLEPRPVYEIIAGERRWRGAVIADLLTMPVLVRDDLDDDQVAEMQLVENIEREDLDPLEEADGFELLRAKYGYTVAQIGAKIAHGKGESYVYKRLTLTKLVPEVRAAMYEEPALDVSIALLMARYDADAQPDVLAYLRSMKLDGHWPSFRQAQPALAKAFHLVLANAVFDIASEDLVPAAGSCTACPKRSGNQGDIFGDASAPDSCTDTACFQGKREAHAAMVKKQAEKAGFKVIDGEEARRAKVGTTSYDVLIGYERLDKMAYVEEGKDGEEREVTFGDALRGMGKKAPKHLVFIDPHSLEPIPVITQELANKLVPDKGEATPKGKVKGKNAADAAWPLRKPDDGRPPEERALDNHHVAAAALLRVFDAIRAAERTTEELRLVAKVLIGEQEGTDEALRYMGFHSEDEYGPEYEKELSDWFDALLPEQLGQLLAMASAELAMGRYGGCSLPAAAKVQLLQRYGIDIEAVQAKVAEDLERGEQQEDDEVTA